KEFARIIVTLVHHELPEFTTLERKVADRKGKMYLDFLQNRPQATIASVYSLRPKPGATVSMPLDWHEVKPGLQMSDFTIYNAVERVLEKGDLSKPVVGKGVDMEKAIARFEKETSDWHSWWTRTDEVMCLAANRNTHGLVTAQPIDKGFLR